MKKLLVFIILLPSILLAQSNEIPYNSKGNTLALTVENTATTAAKSVVVHIENPPQWLKLESANAMLQDIPPKGSKDAEFRFAVDKAAPVGTVQTLKAIIRTGNGEQWLKEISVTVGAPKEYHLYDNFPNPFNPSTKIAFELPTTAKVRVVIYDALGRAIRTLTDEEHQAGYIELSWDGKNKNGTMVASGVYFFQASTATWNSIKKMIVLR